MEKKEIDPPYKPIIKNANDITNFDKIYTEDKSQESINSGYASPNQFPVFDGFTFHQSPKFDSIPRAEVE